MIELLVVCLAFYFKFLILSIAFWENDTLQPDFFKEIFIYLKGRVTEREGGRDRERDLSTGSLSSGHNSQG